MLHQLHSQTDMEVTTALPHALGPEKALVSIILQNNLVNYPRFIESGMSIEMFYLPAHVKLMSHIMRMTDMNQSIELVSLVQRLLDSRELDEIGGPAALTELWSYSPTDSKFDHYCEIIKTKYIARRLHGISNEISDSSPETKEDVQNLISKVESEMSELSGAYHAKSDSSISGAIGRVVDQFKALVTSDDPKSLFGLSTGFARMDSLTLGLKKQEVFVIGARPSVGKTSVLLNIINRACIEDGVPTLFFSCEMSKEQIISRQLYSIAKLPFHKLTDRNGPRYVPSKQELIRMKEATEKLKAAPYYVEDKGGITIEDLRATARRHKRQYGIGLICIDYLQLVRCYTKMAQTSKNAEVTEVSSQIKALAKELDLPVVVLSQLNRGPSSGKTQRPRMSDLRDSGSIEQDADMIGLLHRYDYEGAKERIGEAEINLTKNRNGPTGVIDLEWKPEITQFVERATQYQ